MAETLVGHLHVLRTAKHPRGGILDRLVQYAMQDVGILKVEEYPPTYFMHIDGRTVGEERAKLGDDRELRTNNLYMFRFKGRPKLLDREMEGYDITVRGSYEPWHNGMGGYLKNYRVVSVSPSTSLCACKEID